ncbi:hypothetical protein T265_02984 [Opisthorchis viverrini]|uniref:Reverse transcriptase domain-containing protein n=1 Tax=Opisthorchis viverrini TaxID=6198 RepID=A0A075AHX3_OPIVI|nr:hypothetical protein T265_02984 [Opisthorchis viverrini]KER30634.1 hypothetical protein T265_02984 [Opisthorchis viverrini]
MSSAFQIYMIATSRILLRLQHEAAWCSTFSYLETSQTRDSAGFQVFRSDVRKAPILHTLLEHRHTCERPTILVFLDFRGAFDSVDRSLLLDTLVHQGMSRNSANIIRSLYFQTSGRVRVYGELSKSFRTQYGVRQGCPLSPFLFNFVIDEIMRRTLEGGSNPTSTCGLPLSRLGQPGSSPAPVLSSNGS